MVDPEEMRRRVHRVYERRKGGWMRGLVADGLLDQVRITDDAVASSAISEASQVPDTSLDVNLAPPTQRDVLRDVAGVGDWVHRWERYEGPGEVVWEERRWASAGTQRIPVRVRFHDVDGIAREAGCIREWHRLGNRARDLVRLVGEMDAALSPTRGQVLDIEGISDVARRLTSVITSTTKGDWEIALEVLRWIGSHRDIVCYVRELPIRGIDTKWIEARRKLVLPLAKALLGLDELPFKKAPDLIRARALGEGVLPAGLTDVSLTAPELARLDPRPSRVVVCENLISVLTLPAMEGTLALFGAGYGVGSRLAIPWLDEVDLYYWGDLDTHGFRILDGFRKHHPRALSVLMDGRTLEACRDLWVEEPDPFTGELARLTDGESEVFEFLCRQSPVPRLEQERIPYEMVKERIASLPGEGHAAF